MICFTQRLIVLPALLCPRPVGGGGGIKRSSASVRLSDVAYIGSNSKTKRPTKTKLCTGVPQVTCDSHTDFKVKSQLSRGGGILWRPPSRTACLQYADSHLRSPTEDILVEIYFTVHANAKLVHEHKKSCMHV